jgi:CBS-domain-containing membrane protein
MKKTFGQMVVEFRLHWKNYVFQSLLATLVLLLALWVMKTNQMILVASLGATAFIVFTLPNSATAQPRNVIGGHTVGLVCGLLCHLLTTENSPYVIVAYAVAVGVSMFVMVVFDLEHPPAAGTALGIAILGAGEGVILAVFTGALLLALAHITLRRWLRDLA